MGIELNRNRTNRTRTLISERTEQNPNPLLQTWQDSKPNRILAVIEEPEQNRTPTMRVLSLPYSTATRVAWLVSCLQTGYFSKLRHVWILRSAVSPTSRKAPYNTLNNVPFLPSWVHFTICIDKRREIHVLHV